jgi:hypothetical protein
MTTTISFFPSPEFKIRARRKDIDELNTPRITKPSSWRVQPFGRRVCD